jgi:hypothetical protein
MTPAQRSLYGRIGAAVARSKHDPRDLTREARRTFLERFEREIRDESPDLPDAEVQRRAGELRRAHMLQLSVKSSIARGKKRTASPATGLTAQEVDRVSDDHHHRPAA